MEEYFKMMGGLRSMVEIGFSLVALGNFGSQSWELLKKIVGFLLKTSQSLAQRVAGVTVFSDKLVPVLEKVLLIPQSSKGPSLKSKLLIALRIISAIGKFSN